MEPDELERYIALKDRCTDIANEIYPHYKDLYPGGVKEMTALDPELSDEARAVKIRWFEKVLERLLKLQSRIASSATKQCTASNVRQCATSSFTPSTFLLRNNPCCAAFFSDATCLNADCTASSSWISCCMEKQVNWGKIDGSATILEFLHRGNLAQRETGAPKRACGRF